MPIIQKGLDRDINKVPMLQSRLKIPARLPRLVAQKANVGTKLNYIENRLYKYGVRVVSKIVAPGSKYKGGWRREEKEMHKNHGCYSVDQN